MQGWVLKLKGTELYYSDYGARYADGFPKLFKTEELAEVARAVRGIPNDWEVKRVEITEK